MRVEAEPGRCMKCVHHMISYDMRFPYACGAMGFKSRQLPQREILAITGEYCLAYEPRATVRKERD